MPIFFVNPAHPESAYAHLPLTFSEGIGGRRKYIEPPILPETKAERAAYERMKAGMPPQRTRTPMRKARTARRTAAAPAARRGRKHHNWHRVKAHDRRTNPSTAQLAARRRFAEAARAGTLRKGTKLGTGTARPRRAFTSPRHEERAAMARHHKRRKGATARNSPRKTKRHRKNSHRRASGQFMRKRAHGHRTNTHRRNTHRRHKRNPSFSVRGIGGQLLEASKRGAVIIIAQAATNRVASMVPLGDGTSLPLTVAKQAAIGLVLSMLARKAMPRYANDVLVGALLAPLTSIARTLPVLGTALAGAPPGLGLYSGRPFPQPRALRGAPPGLGLYDSTLPRGGQGALPMETYYN